MDIERRIILIKGVPRTHSNESIVNLFSQCGTIKESVHFLLSNLQQKIIFIEYSQSLEADIAVVVLDRVIPTGGEYPLIVDYAEKSLSEERLIFYQESSINYNNINNQNNHVPENYESSNNNNNNNNDNNNNFNNDDERNHESRYYNYPNNNNNNAYNNPNYHYNNSNNSTVDSIESYISVSTSDNSIFDLDRIHNCISIDTTVSSQTNDISSNVDDLSISSTPFEENTSSVHNPVLRVTFRGVPPNIDIMSFSFLKTFGTVLEGRMVEDTLNLYSPDGTCCLTPVYTGIVIFTILTHSMLSAENLMILNGSIGSLTDHTFLFHMFSHSL